MCCLLRHDLLQQNVLFASKLGENKVCWLGLFADEGSKIVIVFGFACGVHLLLLVEQEADVG